MNKPRFRPGPWLAAGLLAAALHAPGHAQNPRRPRQLAFPDSLKARSVFLGLSKGDMVIIKAARKPNSPLVVGDTLLVGPAGATLTDVAAERLGLGQFERNDSLLKLENMRLEITGLQILIRDSLLARWENVHRIDSAAFDSLHKGYQRANALITRSTQNTDRAIRHSYYLSIVLGAVGGGLAGAMTDDKTLYIPIGALAGAVAGPILNWGLVELSAHIWPLKE